MTNPTQADMKLVEDIDEILLEDATDEGYELASKRVAQHVQEAVKAETKELIEAIQQALKEVQAK